MGLVLQLRVIWLLMNLYLCAIAIALTVPGSSGFNLPVSVEASSVAPPIETVVLIAEPEGPEPLLNGPIIQPPSKSLAHDSPPPLTAETPHGQQQVSTPSPAAEPLHYLTPRGAAEPPHDSTLPLVAQPPEPLTPTPIVEPPQPLTLPPLLEGKPGLSPQPLGLALPPLTVPLPLEPLLPLPSLSPAEPPHESSPIPVLVPPQTSPTTFWVQPPLAMPRHSLSPLPPVELPQVSPPPSSTIPGATQPYASAPPPLMASPNVPPPSVIPVHTPYAPPPSELSHSSVPPSPAMQEAAPLAMPRHSLPPLPPVELPQVSPPPSSTIPGATPPYASAPPPLMASPNVPPPSVIPVHTPYAPPPSELSHSSVPPLPAMQEAAPAVPPPHASPRKEMHGRVPPPVPDPPEQSRSSSIPPLSAPPVSKATSESHPPISHQIEAPQHSAPVVRSNVSEAHASPLPAPVPPPGRVPVVLSPAPNPAPHHGPPLNRTPSEPKFGRQNETAPTPFSFREPSPSSGSHFSPHYSPVKGSPLAEVPPSTSEVPDISPAPSPIQRRSSGHSGIVFLSPKFSPPGSSTRNTTRRVVPSMQALPPPPPNQDCAYLTCTEPFTNTPPGSPCGCVWPMQVGLRLSMAVYTFFPLVSELAKEIAPGVSMKPSQVRVMGAKSSSQEPEKTIVLVDLVPLHDKFDDITASLTFQRFWHKQIHIDKSIFGDYDVLYVRYPGLPPSPPMAPADIAVINSMPYSVRDNNGSILHPLGVILPEKRHKDRLNGSLIAVIIFSTIVGVMICFSVAWLLIFRYTTHNSQPALTLRGPPGHSAGSGRSSSLSLGSSLGKYPGSAKTFSASEIEKATDNFNPSRILGEGGFGCVYRGTLGDGTSVAVKVLTRDDKRGGREFLAEVEMLSRVHHRNLVKLIGICTDDSMRCLVYELVPNGSVEYHLHGADKETTPLDWSSRLKIALGAARGLAYLHEDSNPGIIHRDFKSSNILLGDDFTPKVSDFGLARTAMDDENRHSSTHIMGTFGYVAPEYAMTGHLLAKSDVYSYGVVLLELLTGRRPIDMLQPPGQENLVAWARPLLTSKEGLESIIDPSLLSSDVSLDSVAKVAAIASMCVQLDVCHRPFMGEVVQALKLVCNECDDSKDGNSRDCSPRNIAMDFDAKVAMLLDDVEKGLAPGRNIVSMSERSGPFGGHRSSPFQRLSASGPIRNARGSKFWQSVRKLSQGSLSEHGTTYRLWPGSH